VFDAYSSCRTPGAQGRRVLLTVVTVVFNDPRGLERTLRSVAPHLTHSEHWIIDGSTDGAVRALVRAQADPRVQILSEPDDGLYDAMNKGLGLATGDYVIFLNAGDVFVPDFDPAAFLPLPAREVIVGYALERYGDHLFLRPARGRESYGLAHPAHPATAYPLDACRELRYDPSLPISADGDFTGRVMRQVGGKFVSAVVAEFGLGGRSSAYQDLDLVLQRVRCGGSGKDKAKLIAKAILWRLVPRVMFYRILAWRKYEHFTAGTDGSACQHFLVHGDVATRYPLSGE